MRQVSRDGMPFVEQPPGQGDGGRPVLLLGLRMGVADDVEEVGGLQPVVEPADHQEVIDRVRVEA